MLNRILATLLFNTSAVIIMFAIYLGSTSGFDLYWAGRLTDLGAYALVASILAFFGWLLYITRNLPMDYWPTYRELLNLIVRQEER